jgi:hypothetical protein
MSYTPRKIFAKNPKFLVIKYNTEERRKRKYVFIHQGGDLYKAKNAMINAANPAAYEKK